MRSNLLLLGLMLSVPVIVFPLTFGIVIYTYGWTIFWIQSILICFYIIFKVQLYSAEIRTGISKKQRNVFRWFNLRNTQIAIINLTLLVKLLDRLDLILFQRFHLVYDRPVFFLSKNSTRVQY